MALSLLESLITPFVSWRRPGPGRVGFECPLKERDGLPLQVGGIHPRPCEFARGCRERRIRRVVHRNGFPQGGLPAFWLVQGNVPPDTLRREIPPRSTVADHNRTADGQSFQNRVAKVLSKSWQ